VTPLPIRYGRAVFTPLPVNHFVKHDGGGLMEQTAGFLRPGQRTKAFSVALAMHGLLAAAVIYLVVPPLPRPDEPRPIEIVKLPESPRVEPPKVIPPKPVVRPSPPKVVTPPPRPIPPPVVIPDPTPPVSPVPVAPVQETPLEPSRVEPAPVAPSLPSPPKVEEYVAPSSDAAYLHNPKPAYPLIAQRRGWQGVTLLEVRVSAQGKPLSVSIKKSSGYAVLDDTARDTVLNSYRFEPARRNGEKVEATVELPMRFSLN